MTCGCARTRSSAPLVSILPSRNLRAAVSIANDSQFGLTAGVFTTNLNKALYAARHIESGVVTINQTPTFRVEHMPFGGVKRSGLGREGVKYAIEEMTELKMVVIQEMDIPDA